MGWKITSIRLSDEDMALLKAEKEATKKSVTQILVAAWKEKRGKGAGETDSVMDCHASSVPPSAQAEVV